MRHPAVRVHKRRKGFRVGVLMVIKLVVANGMISLIGYPVRAPEEKGSSRWSSSSGAGETNQPSINP